MPHLQKALQPAEKYKASSCLQEFVGKLEAVYFNLLDSQMVLHIVTLNKSYCYLGPGRNLAVN